MARMREGASLLTVTDKGYGKRTMVDEYRIQNRGGYGLLNYKVNEDKGSVCGIKVVDEADDIILISSDGIIIRILCSDIRIMGRYATGVRVMKVQGESRVVSFTRTDHDEDADIEKVDEPDEKELEAQMKEAEAEEAENLKAELEDEASETEE